LPATTPGDKEEKNQAKDDKSDGKNVAMQCKLTILVLGNTGNLTNKIELTLVGNRDINAIICCRKRN
jgi:hypothetical protein